MNVCRLVAALAGFVFLAGCSDDAPEPARGRQLTLTLQGLEPLQNGFHYEAWALVGGQPLGYRHGNDSLTVKSSQ